MNADNLQLASCMECGETAGRLAEEGLRHALDSHEKKNGGPFPQRKANLKGGRPMK
jgi:hypothetical protein